MIKKGPCTCWLVFDTNFSGAGIWCAFGMNYVTGDYSSFGTMHSHPFFCICPSSTWAGITNGIIFSSVVILLVVHPLRSSPGRLQYSLLFHQADQAAPAAQISLLSVAQRRSETRSWRQAFRWQVPGNGSLRTDGVRNSGPYPKSVRNSVHAPCIRDHALSVHQ